MISIRRFVFGPRIYPNLSGAKYTRNHQSPQSLPKRRLSSTAFLGKMFNLKNYDCIGFDLDNTILRYKVANMVQMEYNVLVEFLINERGYSGRHLTRPLTEQEDILQKGLILDFNRGNLLRIRRDGIVLKASHGTTFLSEDEIREVYGEGRTWDIGQEFAGNVLEAWNGPLSEKLRNLLDYFDMPVSAIFSRIVDTLDEDNGGRPLDKYNIWPDILAGLMHIYSREHFDLKSNYFKAIKCNPERFIYKTSPLVLDWLRDLRKEKTTFLLTGSHMDFADFTSTFAMGGKSWTDLFDLIVCFARKPGFFTENRPFYQLNGYDETHPVNNPADLSLKQKFYCQGNTKDLNLMLEQKCGKANPKILYLGDNMIQDVYTPNSISNWDTLAIVEELLAEHVQSDGAAKIPLDYKLLGQSKWGSYFHVGQTPSFWFDVIRTHAQICVPALDTLAEFPIDHDHASFDTQPKFPIDKSSSGFHY